MKILNFILWQWRRTQVWQKWFMLCFALLGATALAPMEIKLWLYISAMFVPLFFVFKWWVWDGIRDAWKKYHDEQQQLIDIVRDKK